LLAASSKALRTSPSVSTGGRPGLRKRGRLRRGKCAPVLMARY